MLQSRVAAPRHATALVLAAVLLAACVPNETFTPGGAGGSGGTAGGSSGSGGAASGTAGTGDAGASGAAWRDAPASIRDRSAGGERRQ